MDFIIHFARTSGIIGGIIAGVLSVVVGLAWVLDHHPMVFPFIIFLLMSLFLSILTYTKKQGATK